MLDQTTPEHFTQAAYRAVRQMLESYFTLTGGIITVDGFAELCRRGGVDEAKTMLYVEVMSDLVTHPVDEPSARFAVETLRHRRADERTAAALADAMEILTAGKDFGRDGFARGHDAARQFLLAELGRIDRLDQASVMPEGNIFSERAEVFAEYAERAKGAGPVGIMSGVEPLDAALGGFQPAELVLVCGYTGVGKTTLVAQTAWYAAVKLGLNVYYATSETIRPQVRRKIIARHSREAQFGIAGGLDSQAIKMARLDPAGVAGLQAVVDDLSTNPSYGKLWLTQVPRRASLGVVEGRLLRVAAQMRVDLIVIDYLALLRSERKWASKREDMDELIRDAKVLAATFDEGRGVPLISPWAMSQTAWREARTCGEYALANLAETSEAEKSADVIISLLDQANTAEVKMQVLKARDAAKPSPVQLDVDYKTSYVAARQRADTTGLLD